MAKHAAAENLLDRIVSNDVTKVEEFLALGDSILWRELIRYEFNIQSLKNPAIRHHPLLPKLLAYEIKTISSFHLAALMGTNDILMSLMEKDVPVDIPLLSGTTALHIACFAGMIDTVNLLIEVYKADLQRVDGYGWSALHYACTEGHLAIVELLIGLNMDVNARDQDGTTPAFRAEVNGHQQVVKYLLQHGSDDDQLNLEDRASAKSEAERIADLYTKVNKTKNKPPQISSDERSKSAEADSTQPQANGSAVKAIPESAQNMIVSAPAELNRSVSEGSGLSGYLTGPKPTKKSSRQSTHISRSKTLPSKYKNNPPTSPEKKEKIRRIIRKELEMSFGSEYETPVADSKSTIWEEEEFKDIGVKTLTGIMREEFEKYKQELQAPLEPAPTPKVQNRDDSDYEDLYASLANLPEPPKVPSSPDIVSAPPLPPRNPTMERKVPEEVTRTVGNQLTLSSPYLDNPALTESFLQITPLLGKNWKKLSHALPLEDTPTKVDDRITAIEKQAPKSVTEQALRCLTEWRVKKGKGANVDSLILALRKCNLHPLITEVEKATQEFTA